MIDNILFRSDFIIITGGPGSGKTTLLDEIFKNNYNYIPEVAREIIRTQVSSEGDALPWKNVKKYRDLMLDKSIESFISAMTNPQNNLYFLIEAFQILLNTHLINIPISKKLESATRKYVYNKKVFILPLGKTFTKMIHTILSNVFLSPIHFFDLQIALQVIPFRKYQR
ncbi:AAA family ATPase [Lysinibacillus sp. RC79]|uniref:AAA family ATPase n=1 Tax=Lysinibacillus sp. RC79 TaxID=3156296 RepID=UPI0035172E78